MNKPAAKEPSMDEILSSIRQIIADDDVGDGPEASAADPSELASDSDEEGLPSFDSFLTDEIGEAEPEPEPEPEPEMSDAVEDVEDALALSLDQVIEAQQADDDATANEEFELPDDIAFAGIEPDVPEPMPAPEPPPQASALPDPDLSGDIAEKLLDSTTEAAAQHAFSRLGVMALGDGNQTIEDVVRELLRPMLKSWLDENLPAIVERLVEREVERVSRGGR